MNKPSTKEFHEATVNYVKAVSTRIRLALSEIPKKTETREWMVPTGPTSQSSQVFSREVLDGLHLAMTIQLNVLQSELKEQNRLISMITDAGIDRGTVMFGYLYPLINRCLIHTQSLEFDEEASKEVLLEFREAVLKSRLKAQFTIALKNLDLPNGPIDLGDSTSIGPITFEQLCACAPTNLDHFGRGVRGFLDIPSSKWMAGNGTLSVSRDQSANRALHDYTNALITAFCLLSPGNLDIDVLANRTNFGTQGISVADNPNIRFGRGLYAIDSELEANLRQSWPTIRSVMTSPNHDLKMSAERLLEGAKRTNPADTILDFSIGLERLITYEAQTEVRYRFSLRGATVMCWSGGDKTNAFKDLQKLYDARSKIAHGGTVTPKTLNEARVIGEQA